MRAAIYEAGAGKWRIVYDAPPGPDGRRRQKSVSGRSQAGLPSPAGNGIRGGRH